MALMRNRPGALARRVVTWSLAVDVVAGLLIGIVVAQVVGLVIFLIGLVVTGLLYWNLRQVERTRGRRY
ncbi:MAG TPA: hypothetical protein VF898_08510 [Chloroflexota bacterium]